MTTQDIIIFSRRLHEAAVFCRGDNDNWLSYAMIEEIQDTLLIEANIIDYMAGGEKVRLVVMLLRKALREFLESAAESTGEDSPRRWRLTECARDRAVEEFGSGLTDDDVIGVEDAITDDDVVGSFEFIVTYCELWLNWIDLYFPPVEAAAHQEARPKAERPKSAAAVRLESQELQGLKQDLVDAGLIVNGVWVGTPAQYGELVRHLKEDCGVENRGGYAWKDCRDFVGYEGSDKSAQNAITSNLGDVKGDRAEAIRHICRRHRVH